jgi:lipopolysaccharide/colanic/teichoic acid biosynthesis glycosyltransferase
MKLRAVTTRGQETERRWHLMRTRAGSTRRGGKACPPPGKRILDYALAAALLLVTAPVIVIAAALIRLTNRGPLLLRQVRVGQNETPFTMFKLRTMYVDNDDSAHRELNRRELLGAAMCEQGTNFKLDRDDPRITGIGRFLRRYSIDELPQLINVLRGEMSLVGPRPSLPWEVELFTMEQRRRHDCRPGITGLWQVSERYGMPMPQMLELDLIYIQSRSMLLDLWILFRTPYAAFFGGKGCN